MWWHLRPAHLIALVVLTACVEAEPTVQPDPLRSSCSYVSEWSPTWQRNVTKLVCAEERADSAYARSQKAAGLSPAPPQMDENKFWAVIEEAWQQTAPEEAKVRGLILTRVDWQSPVAVVRGSLNRVLDTIRRRLRALPLPVQDAFERIFDDRTHDVGAANLRRGDDREALQLLFQPFFVVALGKSYYEAVVSGQAPAAAARAEDRAEPGPSAPEQTPRPAPQRRRRHRPPGPPVKSAEI